MRKQYHLRPSKNGLYAWDVDRLVSLSKHFEIREIPLDSIRELDENFWFGCEGDVATCRAIVEHTRLTNNADLSYPIILCAEGRVMDGMHRVSKALLEGRDRISAVQFSETPEPDFEDVCAVDLPYD